MRKALAAVLAVASISLVSATIAPVPFLRLEMGQIYAK